MKLKLHSASAKAARRDDGADHTRLIPAKNSHPPYGGPNRWPPRSAQSPRPARADSSGAPHQMRGPGVQTSSACNRHPEDPSTRRLCRRSPDDHDQPMHYFVELHFGDSTGAVDDDSAIGGEQSIRANPTVLVQPAGDEIDVGETNRVFIGSPWLVIWHKITLSPWVRAARASAVTSSLRAVRTLNLARPVVLLGLPDQSMNAEFDLGMRRMARPAHCFHLLRGACESHCGRGELSQFRWPYANRTTTRIPKIKSI